MVQFVMPDLKGLTKKMAKILITGASGLLGSSLAPFLSNYGHAVFTTSRITGTDLTSIDQTFAALYMINPEVVVNLSAATNVDECEVNPQFAYLANVKIVENIVKWIQINNKCHLIHISTDQVYDGVGFHKEDDITIINYYGFSKYAGELATRLVSSTILRTNFFGMSKNHMRHSFSDWLVRELSNENKITVFDDVIFSPLSIINLTSFISLVINSKNYGTFNLGSCDSMSKADFVFAFAEELDFSTKNIIRGSVKDAKLSAPRPKNMSMNSSLFMEKFGVSLPSLKDEILLACREYRNEKRLFVH
jgi:dTDP-4-dehydrorhamnose reductase